MENNLHINERLEKQKVNELLERRKDIPAENERELNELLNSVIGELVTNTRFIAPAVLHSNDGNREITFQMIKTREDVSYFPVFTSSEDFEVWEDMKNSDTVLLDFDSYAGLISSNKSIGGIAINPFTDNMRADRSLIAQWSERKQMLTNGYASRSITNDSVYELYELSPYPSRLSDKLCGAAKEMPQVTRIWLRGIRLEGTDGYLAVVEFDGDREKTVKPLGEASKEYLNGKPIHFVPYAPGFGEKAAEGVSPVYTK